MSKVKKLFQNPTLFLYDFCAKRLGGKNYQQQTLVDEILCDQKKQTAQIVSSLKELERQYKELFHKMGPLVEVEVYKELQQQEIKNMALD